MTSTTQSLQLNDTGGQQLLSYHDTDLAPKAKVATCRTGLAFGILSSAHAFRAVHGPSTCRGAMSVTKPFRPLASCALPARLSLLSLLILCPEPAASVSSLGALAIDASGHLLRREAGLEDVEDTDSCVWGSWKDWTRCTVTCGGAGWSRKSSRKVSNKFSITMHPLCMLI